MPLKASSNPFATKERGDRTKSSGDGGPGDGLFVVRCTTSKKSGYSFKVIICSIGVSEKKTKNNTRDDNNHAIGTASKDGALHKSFSSDNLIRPYWQT